MEFPKYIVIGIKDDGYVVAKLFDAGENYYEEIARGDVDKYFDLSEMVFALNRDNYDRAKKIAQSLAEDFINNDFRIIDEDATF